VTHVAVGWCRVCRYKEDSEVHVDKDQVRKAITITFLEVPAEHTGIPPFVRTLWCPMQYSCRFF
jgi:hypothetical protein